MMYFYKDYKKIGEFKTYKEGLKYLEENGIDEECVFTLPDPNGRYAVYLDRWCCDEFIEIVTYETRDLAVAFIDGYLSAPGKDDPVLLHPDGTLEMFDE